jgi:hypothetical protein
MREVVGYGGITLTTAFEPTGTPKTSTRPSTVEWTARAVG